MDDSYARHARRCGLVMAEPETFAVRRLKRGAGHRFVGEDGRSPGRDVTARLKALAIPPAWSQVRCSAEPRHHVLVVGTDGTGRRQYIYHPDWERVRDAVKAERLIRFGRALPRIRATISRDLAERSTERSDGRGRRRTHSLRRVAAVAARLVDRAAMRPGNEAYAANGHRGATTLSRDDVRIEGERIALDYVGKSGREHRFAIRDRVAARAMRKLKQRRPASGAARARRLFVYSDGSGTRRALTAAKLNRYIASAARQSVSAKDFRTFIGSARALEILNGHSDARAVDEKRRAVGEAVRAASERLRNTPAVARSSYVLPSIIADFEGEGLPRSLFRGPTRRGLDRYETALMRHLEAARKNGG